ncbi:MAG: hypothetical protein AB199_02610 [Parcubacteria bacterium C7867-004]|nr:MAG: hypothetical protein AB199_02610 [Parcubacteria bacterium C7867-004]
MTDTVGHTAWRRGSETGPPVFDKMEPATRFELPARKEIFRPAEFFKDGPLIKVTADFRSLILQHSPAAITEWNALVHGHELTIPGDDLTILAVLPTPYGLDLSETARFVQEPERVRPTGLVVDVIFYPSCAVHAAGTITFDPEDERIEFDAHVLDEQPPWRAASIVLSLGSRSHPGF